MDAKRSFTTDDAREIATLLGVHIAEEKFGLQDFRAGLNVELEHGRRNPETDVTHDDPLVTGKIALAHLREMPDYYRRLVEMEAEAEGQKVAPAAK